MILFPILLRFNDLSIERELGDFDSNITKLYQFSSVQSLSCVWQVFVASWTVACQASLSITNSGSLLKLMSFESVTPSNHLILCRPLLLLPSIVPSIRVSSNESVLYIRWPKYYSFSFSISPSNECSGLISFRMDWLDLLAVQGTLKSLLQHHSSKASILGCSAFFIVQLSDPYMIIGKAIALTRWTFIDKSNVSTFKICCLPFLPRSKHLLFSWLQSPSAVVLEPIKIKSTTVYPSICHEVMGPDVMILVFWMLSFKPTFSLSYFTFIKRLFSCSLLSAIRVMSSAYLRLLIFLPAIVIPLCASSSPAFHLIYSAYKLNRQGDNIQPWCTSFPIWTQSVVPFLVLFLLDLHKDFSGGRSGDLVFPSLSEFPTVCCDPHKGFGIVNKAEVDVFLELLFDDPANIGNLISGSSAFSKTSLNIWKFMVHVLLKSGLENFEHYFVSMWNELILLRCIVVPKYDYNPSPYWVLVPFPHFHLQSILINSFDC